jgi:hypothetical protein
MNRGFSWLARAIGVTGIFHDKNSQRSATLAYQRFAYQLKAGLENPKLLRLWCQRAKHPKAEYPTLTKNEF